MFCKRLLITVFGLAALFASSAATALAPEPAAKVELSAMAGRWYEVARIPNSLQKGCQAGTADWIRSGDGYSVVQACRKGSPVGPRTEWKAKAKVVDPRSNAKFRMSFFGGLMSQEYWVLDARPDQGWLILGTPGGNYLWLMSQRPALSAPVRSQALTRIKQLGYDIGRLEFPIPARD
jgi:apolipoprotein D and lipocalin family protein